jgi:Zn-finger nucleic acid-binding protein
MDKSREAAFAEAGMMTGNLDDRFGLTFRAIHASMIRAAWGGLQLANRVAGLPSSNSMHLLYKPTPFATVQQNRLTSPMQCPNCHNDLVEIPTLEGPQVDVCPDQHGLWLDRGEANLFVENYRALRGTPSRVAPGAIAVHSTCPRCREALDEETVLATALFACRACRGWWLPKGSLTQLNATARGSGAPIHLDEADFYRRAGMRALQSQAREGGSAVQPRRGPRMQQVWFWTLFWSTALFFAGLILLAGIRNIVAPVQWITPPDTTLGFLALGAIGGMGLTLYGFVINNRKRLIESIPTSPVRSLAVGLVEVSGRAQAESALLRAPFSGMPCVLFSYSVEERRKSGNETRWETIAKGTSEEPFYVQDDTGRVLVVPFEARLILPDKRTTRSNWSGTLPEDTIVGLLKLGVAVDGWLGEKTIRCSETFILPDERVYVMGTAQEYRGVADSTENSARLYVGSSRDNEFIISDRSEKELLSRLQWQVWASIGGGTALALVCLLLVFKLYGTGH